MRQTDGHALKQALNVLFLFPELSAMYTTSHFSCQCEVLQHSDTAHELQELLKTMEALIAITRYPHPGVSSRFPKSESRVGTQEQFTMTRCYFACPTTHTHTWVFIIPVTGSTKRLQWSLPIVGNLINVIGLIDLQAICCGCWLIRCMELAIDWVWSQEA